MLKRIAKVKLIKYGEFFWKEHQFRADLAAEMMQENSLSI